MNFFTFNSASSELKIARNFWIYVVFSVPLTLLTVAWWYFKTQHRKKDGEDDGTNNTNSFTMSHIQRFDKVMQSVGEGSV